MMANETLNIQNGVSPITIDTEVTEGSMRPVTSDGIYKAIQAGGGGGSGDVLFVTVTRDENGDVTGSMSASEALAAQTAGKNVIINLNDYYEDEQGYVKQFVAIPFPASNGMWKVVRPADPFVEMRTASNILASVDGWAIHNASAEYLNCLVIGRAGVPYFINNNDEEIIPDYMQPREEHDFGDAMETLIVYAMQSANPEITLAVDLSAPGTISGVAAILQAIRDKKYESPALAFTVQGLSFSASLENISASGVSLSETFSFAHVDNSYNDGSLIGCTAYDFTLSFNLEYDLQGDAKTCSGILTCKKNTATIVPMS